MTGLAADAWVEDIIRDRSDTWKRAERFLKRNHLGADWMPQLQHLPVQRFTGAPLPYRVIDAIQERAPLAADLLRYLVTHPSLSIGAEWYWFKDNYKGKSPYRDLTELKEAAQAELWGIPLYRVIDLRPAIVPPFDIVIEGQDKRAGKATQADYDTLRALGIEPEDYMDEARDGIAPMTQFGCGWYGCVMSTWAPNVVLKLTTDTSEAMFANVAANAGREQLGEARWRKLNPVERARFQPPGVVKYFAVAKLKGINLRGRDDKEERAGGRSVYLLWREAAHDIGYLKRPKTSSEKQMGKHLEAMNQIVRPMGSSLDQEHKALGSPRQYRRFLERVQANFAMLLRDPTVADFYDNDDEDADPAWSVATRLEWTKDLLETIRDSPGKTTQNIGAGLLQWLLQEQIVLGDVHRQNVGKDAAGNAVVSDPGVAIEVGPANYPPPFPMEEI